jgi:quinohemoprotein ethanol dehydrogenase
MPNVAFGWEIERTGWPSGIRRAVMLLAGVAILASCGDRQETETRPGWIDRDRLLAAAAEPQNWLTIAGQPDGAYFSPLTQINAENVDRIGMAWTYDMGTARGQQASPIVVDGRMYTSGVWGRVYALEAATGKELWTFDPEPDGQYARNACCDVINRGVAVWQGAVYVNSTDGWLFALDAETGAVRWKVDTFIDRTRPYSAPSSAHVAGDVVVVGNAGADFNVRGYISAYDLTSGDLRWRFFTVPRDPALGPQDHPDLEKAAETWDRDSLWKMGGGGTVWDSMLYDPRLNLLYVGTGNGSPYSWRDRSPSGGDNLYLASILAINPDTGRLVWHYQTDPGENWDYTATMKMVAADIEIDGAKREVLMQAPKNGFFYVLDRRTGELISAKPFVRTNWASSIDLKTGKPVLTGLGDYHDSPKIVFPSAIGGRTWRSMTYNPGTGLVYIPAVESAWVYVNLLKGKVDPDPNTSMHVLYMPMQAYDPARIKRLYGMSVPPLATLAAGQSPPKTEGWLRAWNPRTQTLAWQRPAANDADGGTMSTAGNLLIQGNTNGELVFMAADTGRELKRIQTGSAIVAAPVSYSVDGVQYIAVQAGLGGADGWAFAPGTAPYKYGNANRILVFRLDGGAPVLPEEIAIPPIPAPPAQTGTLADIAMGDSLFRERCAACHANAGPGVTPDLRKMTPETHAVFRQIVHGGLYAPNGMPRFDDLLSEQEVDQIHAYLIDLSAKAYAEQDVQSR